MAGATGGTTFHLLCLLYYATRKICYGGDNMPDENGEYTVKEEF